jgi:hypothetical protein
MEGRGMIYLVKGFTDDGVEWQFSDGPSGRRGSSADYVSLSEGLADHAGCEINTAEADFTPEEAAVFASVDTHPEGGDVKQAPFMGSAVPKADAQTQPGTPHDEQPPITIR